MSQLKICSLNVRGTREHKKCKAIFNFLKKKGFDVIMLQETHVNDGKEAKLWDTEWGSKTVHSFSTTSALGVCFLFNKKSNIEILDVLDNEDGRILTTRFKLDNKIYLCTNVYGPNSDNQKFFLHMIMQHEQLHKYDCEIIGGDFNLVLQPEIDRHNSMFNHTKSLTIINEFIEKKGLCDAWRVLHPQTRRYSWHRPAKTSTSRIDFLLIPNFYLDVIRESDIIPASFN